MKNNYRRLVLFILGNSLLLYKTFTHQYFTFYKGFFKQIFILARVRAPAESINPTFTQLSFINLVIDQYDYDMFQICVATRSIPTRKACNVFSFQKVLSLPYQF